MVSPFAPSESPYGKPFLRAKRSLSVSPSRRIRRLSRRPAELAARFCGNTAATSKLFWPISAARRKPSLLPLCFPGRSMLHFWKNSAVLEDVRRNRERGGHSPPAAPDRRLGILPSAFNPVTVAHVELAQQAMLQYRLDEVLLTLPRAFPHKGYVGPTFEERIEMLLAAAAEEPRLSAGSTDGGLFIEIVRECREVYGCAAEFFIVCGSDAAERAIAWDYARQAPAAGPFAEQIKEFQMLVAPRGGPWTVPPEYAGRIHLIAWPH